MTKSQIEILKKVTERPHTRSELITVACRNGCRSVRRAEFLIDQLEMTSHLSKYRNEALDIRLYVPGEKYEQEADRGVDAERHGVGGT